MLVLQTISKIERNIILNIEHDALYGIMSKNVI